MDLTSAFTYPFKSIPKVLTIVLVFTISLVVFVAMLLNSYDWVAYLQALEVYAEYGYEYMPYVEPPSATFFLSLIGLLVVAIGQGVWLSGYGLSIIRHIMEGFEALPKIEFGRNMRDGLSVFLASLWYGFVAFIFFFGLMIAMGILAMPNIALLNLISFLGGLIGTIVFVCLLGWSFFVGMSRCAADNNRDALYQIPTNMKIARANWKTSFSLTGYQILLGLMFWFGSQAINTGVQFVTEPFFGNSIDMNSVIIATVITLLVSYTMNIVQQFASLHLVAQFAYNIGIMVGYDDEFDTF